jgi:hypothetical protein
VESRVQCDLGAVVIVNDSSTTAPVAHFVQLRNVPGLGVGHPAVLYDAETGLYWMVNNRVRESTWPLFVTVSEAECGPARVRLRTASCLLTMLSLFLVCFRNDRICLTCWDWSTARVCSSFLVTRHLADMGTRVCSGFLREDGGQARSCSNDRSTLALFYSRNLVDWYDAGLVDYTQSRYRHFTAPSMIIDGRDLLLVTAATIGGDSIHQCASLQICRATFACICFLSFRMRCLNIVCTLFA